MDTTLKPVTRIVFVRHGESDFNEQGRFQGLSDESRLSERGRTTAARCGAHLSPVRFDAILCSPLRRARETAEEIRAAFRHAGHDVPPLTIDDRLREIHLPGWEGLPFETARERFPGQFRVWKESPHLLELPSAGGEAGVPGTMLSPLKDLFAQARVFWREAAARYQGQTVLAVSHGGAIRAILSAALGLSAEEFQRLQQSNGGISALRVSGRARPRTRLLFMNRTQHLGEFLPKTKEGKGGVRVLLLTQDAAGRGRFAGMLGAKRFGFLEKRPAFGPRIEAFTRGGEEGIRTSAWIVPKGPMSEETLKVLRLDAWRRRGLRVEAGGITVLHYPRIDERPILQAVNAPISPGSILEL